MRAVALVTGVALIAFTVWDAFETLILPRRVTRRFRATRLFYRTTWALWRFTARRVRAGGRRETYLSFYGPLSLLLLIALWATSLVFAFALVHASLGPALSVATGVPTFATCIYMSGTTFFTLGLGDVAPASTMARIVTVVEAGMGFGFLALVIGYLPVLFQSFSRREVAISLLDARAGSPPTAFELLRRHAEGPDSLVAFLRDWERSAAELLESHLSYPVLCYFRSQHENESWLGGVTAVLDACALVMSGVGGEAGRQAQLTFAIARHAVVDLTQIFRTPPRAPDPPRLVPGAVAAMREALAAHGLALIDDPAVERVLGEMRGMYEPYIVALSAHLLMPLPPWRLPECGVDNWRTSAWERRVAGTSPRRVPDVHEDDY